MSPDHAFGSLLVGLADLLPAVWDGDAHAIHQARVTTRRSRALVAVLSAAAPASHWDESASRLKRLARALGKTRDVDVSLALTTEVEQRAPMFAPVLAALRTRLVPRQLATRRKLVCRLEEISAAELREMRHQAAAALRLVSKTQLDRALWYQIAEQAVLVQHALQRAGGVYFAGRAHDARIESKKLRYLVEIADAPSHSRALKVLKKSQEALGRVRDREVLLKHLRRLKRPSRGATTSDLREVLEAEIRVSYAAFVERRHEVGAACEAIHRWATSRRASDLRRRMLTAGALGLPSAAVLMLARRAAK
jgi:phosphohistidine phosphatase